MDISDCVRQEVYSYIQRTGDPDVHIRKMRHTGHIQVLQPCAGVMGDETPEVVREVKERWKEKFDLGKYTDLWERASSAVDVVKKTVKGATVFLPDVPAVCRAPDWLLKMTMMYILINLCPRNGQGDPLFHQVEKPKLANVKIPFGSSVGYMPGIYKALTCVKADFFFTTVTQLLSFMERAVAGKLEFFPSLPYKTAPKEEVKKCDKKNRMIQVVSFQAYYYVFQCVLPAFEMVKNMTNGVCIGISSKNGGILQVFQYFAVQVSRYFCVAMKEAYDMLKSWYQGCTDFGEYEGHTTPETGFMFVMHSLALRCFRKPRQRPDAGFMAAEASTWADYIAPYVPMGWDQFWMRLGSVPSGSGCTTIGNSFRAFYTVISLCIYIQKHSLGSKTVGYLGKRGCKCGICERAEDQDWLGKELPLSEIFLFFLSVCQSDDAINAKDTLGFMYPWWQTNVWGQVVKPEALKCGKGKGPEFLQKYVTSDFKTGRATGRAIGKLYHGDNNPTTVMASASSLAYESGENRELYDLCRALYFDVYEVAIEVLDDDTISTEVYEKMLKIGKVDLEETDHFLFPTWEQVQDYNTLDPKTVSQLNTQIITGVKEGRNAFYKIENE